VWAGSRRVNLAGPVSVVALAFVGGAVLAPLADTLMPEAFEHGRPLHAFAIAGGFFLSLVFAAEGARQTDHVLLIPFPIDCLWWRGLGTRAEGSARYRPTTTEREEWAMATKRPSSLARIRYRRVGLASSLMGGGVAGPMFELPVGGPVHIPVTVAEKA
jgi:hypothetical protein